MNEMIIYGALEAGPSVVPETFATRYKYCTYAGIQVINKMASCIESIKEKCKFEKFSLTKEQQEIINCLVKKKKDVFGLLPAGFGKSMILDEVKKLSLGSTAQRASCPI